MEEGRASAQGAAGQAAVSAGESVAVTIYLSGNVAAVVRFLEANGGSPRNVGTDYIEAYVPVSLLGATSEQPGVVRIREIVLPQPHYGPISGQAAGVHRATAWNLDGNTGQGVKVGIIDAGFYGFGDLMGTELPPTVMARCYTAVGQFSNALADCNTRTRHGTAVAESVVDIAPDVSLYIANPYSKGDLQTTVAWMVAQGVDVINHSKGWTFDGPGDGTSTHSNSPLKAVDTAVSGGIIWVNSAGNDARRTWFGTFSDPDNDGLLNFSGDTETIDVSLDVFTSLVVQLRWDDTWPGANRDIDLYLRRHSTGVNEAESQDSQNGGTDDIPLEGLWFRPPFGRANEKYGLVIALREGSKPAWLQLTAWGKDFELHATKSHSIANPAESANAGLLAVGAAAHSSTSTIESFSSQGPTPDNRVKPDLVGADRSSVQSSTAFIGTSQSSAHVAGLAALVLERFPALTPAQAASFLKNQAVQRTESSPNDTDPNNIWGHGFAQLPTPVACRQALIENGTLTNETWNAYCPTSMDYQRGYARDYTFTLAAGSAVTIDLTSSVDTYLHLWSGTTKTDRPLYYDDNGGSGTNARISQTLAAGSYIIEATTKQTGMTGDYNLIVSGLPAASAGVTVSKTALTLSENDGVRTYTVRLNTAPTADVTVTVTGEANKALVHTGTNTPATTATLTFTQTNYAAPQTVTVTGVDDAIDSDRTATITHTVSNTGGYTGVTAPSVSVTLTDDDTRGVTLSKNALTVAENAGSATYTVTLDSEPTASVTVTPVSSDTAEATVSGALTFTTEDWNTPQTVTVTGVDDTSATPAGQTTTITHTVSNTGGYGTVTTPSVSVTLTDDDAVTITPTTLTVAENAGTATYTVVLASQPSAAITVTPVSSDTSKATVSGALTFTGTTWNTAQTVTVTGVDDAIDSDRTATITHTVSNTGGYTNVTAASVAVTLTDDDTRGVTLSRNAVTVEENGGSATYTVVLDSQPTANVTLTPTSSATAEATVSGALTFTPTTWNTPQTVTVTGVNDDVIAPAGHTAAIRHAVSGGYTGVTAASVAVTLPDDDALTVTPTALTVAENAGTATYTVVLNKAPTADVTVTPTSSDTEEATVSEALTFTNDNWAEARTVTVTGVDDDAIVLAGHTATISHTVSKTGGYTNVTVAGVDVTLTDDDAVVISETTLTLAEKGGTATYTVRLGSQPTATVIVTPASADRTVATVSGALTFTANTWDTAQTVTVSGVDDAIDNDSDRSTTITHTVSGGGYDNVTAAGVAVTLTDNDTRGVTLSKNAVTVEENGSSDTYTVVLTSEPTANVTVTPTSDDEGTATVSGMLTFTATTWDTARTVTVTGVDDDSDGDRSATIRHTVSNTGGYDNVTAPDVAVTLIDDDNTDDSGEEISGDLDDDNTDGRGDGGGGGGGGGGTPEPEPAVVRGFFESPAPGAVVSGVDIIRGWSFADTRGVGIEQVELYLDRQRTALIPCCSARPDVAGNFPTAPAANAGQSGWGITTNWGNLTPGPHTLQVVVTSTDGGRWVSEIHPITVLKPGNIAFADRFSLAEAEARLEGNTLVLDGAVIGTATTEQEIVARYAWQTGAQGLRLLASRPLQTARAQPGGMKRLLAGLWAWGRAWLRPGSVSADPGLARFYEAPANRAQVAGIGLIRGWAFPVDETDAIATVTVDIDGGARRESAPCCSTRPDIAAEYPAQANALLSGWGAVTNYGNLAAGEHTLAVRITTTAGLAVTETHTVTVARLGGYAFVNRFDLSGAEVEIVGEDIILSGVAVRDSQTQATRAIEVRLRWSRATQGLVIVDTAVMP